MKFSTDLALDNGILFCPRFKCSANTHRAAQPLLCKILRQILVLCVSVRMRIRADEDETDEVNGECVHDSAAVAMGCVFWGGDTLCFRVQEFSVQWHSKVSQSIMASKPDLWEGANRPDLCTWYVLDQLA